MVRVFVASLILLGSSATAQEVTYSADSLMATFEKNSEVSVKGIEITFHDIVTDNRSSRLTFKTSLSDRIICELTPSSLRATLPAVGSAITVTGKVRGRGLLGNVTLDNCMVTPAAPKTVAVPVLEVLPEPVAIARPPGVIPEQVPLPAAPFMPERIPEPSKKPVPLRSVEQQLVLSAPRAVEQEPASQSNPDHRANNVPYMFYALLVLSGAVGSSILSKVFGATMRSRPALRENTPEVRQAALQALLMKAEKKR
jgi:hypothetical protein